MQKKLSTSLHKAASSVVFILQSTKINAFKRHLKTFLFSYAFKIIGGDCF